MNEYDSARIVDLLTDDGEIVLTERADEADIILFNTCSVREKAQEKVFHDLGRVRALKTAKPDMIIGVGGCVASQEGEAIVKRAPYVDIVFGPQTLHHLPELIAARRQTGKPQVDIRFPEIEKFDHLPPPRVEGVSAFVSIMEGCGKYCTYCIVPYTRGKEISRPFESVLLEVADLADQGVKEITLLGQNVNAYRGQKEDGGLMDLAELLAYLSEVPGIERLRFTTSHPCEMSPALIEAFARLPKLVSHLHLPVQSGSDRVLAAMKRGYTVLEYKSIIRKLRRARPNLSITSDFIVGFPGETDDDFAATLKLVEDARFDGAFNFIYSERPGTPAANLTNIVPRDVQQARFEALQSLLDAYYQSYSAAMVDTVQRVLVTGPAAKNGAEWQARTDNNRVVNFAGAKDLIGQYVNVRVTRAFAHSLRGEWVDAS
jgi:tRNA-2-methylthio-N6-dimethylallyladenosine synthase